MNETTTPDLGFAHYWAQGDIVTHSVAYLLLLMSVASWYYILSKAWAAWRIRRSASAVERFWDAPTMDDAIALLTHADSEQVYSPLATHAVEAVNVKANSSSLNANVDPGELVTRTLRQQINRVSQRLESGLTLLASVGSTAPFIGLFGTVWGIMTAFQAIAVSKNTSLAVVAPGIAEALLATAIGLFAAIPAVIAYNKLQADAARATSRLETFADEFSAILQRQIDERMAPRDARDMAA